MCIFSAITNNLAGMLLGRLFVGIGLGLGPPVASLYVTEVCSIFVSLILFFFFGKDVLLSYLILSHLCKQVSPAFVRGTYGSFIQIATCLGLMGALFIGIPAKDIAGW